MTTCRRDASVSESIAASARRSAAGLLACSCPKGKSVFQIDRLVYFDIFHSTPPSFLHHRQDTAWDWDTHHAPCSSRRPPHIRGNVNEQARLPVLPRQDTHHATTSATRFSPVSRSRTRRSSKAYTHGSYGTPTIRHSSPPTRLTRTSSMRIPFKSRGIGRGYRTSKGCVRSCRMMIGGRGGKRLKSCKWGGIGLGTITLSLCRAGNAWMEDKHRRIRFGRCRPLHRGVFLQAYPPHRRSRPRSLHHARLQHHNNHNPLSDHYRTAHHPVTVSRNGPSQ